MEDENFYSTVPVASVWSVEGWGAIWESDGTLKRWQTIDGKRVDWIEVHPPSAYPAVENDCRVYWGSHGCHLERGHDGPHECECARNPWTGELEPKYDEEGVLNVGTAPYYGPDTNFYGEDVPAASS